MLDMQSLGKMCELVGEKAPLAEPVSQGRTLLWMPPSLRAQKIIGTKAFSGSVRIDYHGPVTNIDEQFHILESTPKEGYWFSIPAETELAEPARSSVIELGLEKKLGRIMSLNEVLWTELYFRLTSGPRFSSGKVILCGGSFVRYGPENVSCVPTVTVGPHIEFAGLQEVKGLLFGTRLVPTYKNFLSSAIVISGVSPTTKGVMDEYWITERFFQ